MPDYILKADTWNPIHRQQLCPGKSAVACQDYVIVVDEAGIGEAEPTNAIGYLPDLLLRMGPGITRVGDKGAWS